MKPEIQSPEILASKKTHIAIKVIDLWFLHFHIPKIQSPQFWLLEIQSPSFLHPQILLPEAILAPRNSWTPAIASLLFMHPGNSMPFMSCIPLHFLHPRMEAGNKMVNSGEHLPGMVGSWYRVMSVMVGILGNGGGSGQKTMVDNIIRCGWFGDTFHAAAVDGLFMPFLRFWRLKSSKSRPRRSSQLETRGISKRKRIGKSQWNWEGCDGWIRKRTNRNASDG